MVLNLRLKKYCVNWFITAHAHDVLVINYNLVAEQVPQKIWFSGIPRRKKGLSK